MAWCQPRLARRYTKVFNQARKIVPLARAEIEKPLIHHERTVLAQLQDRAKQFIDVARLAIGRQAHDLVFAFVDFEAEVNR